MCNHANITLVVRVGGFGFCRVGLYSRARFGLLVIAGFVVCHCPYPPKACLSSVWPGPQDSRRWKTQSICCPATRQDRRLREEHPSISMIRLRPGAEGIAADRPDASRRTAATGPAGGSGERTKTSHLPSGENRGEASCLPSVMRRGDSSAACAHRPQRSVIAISLFIDGDLHKDDMSAVG